jgi:hypothetical protein
MTAFNQDTHRFASAPGWVSSEMTFVPRNVLLVEARERSPYAKGSRVVLVIDRETQLPLIKLVKSDAGNLLRLVLGTFSLAKAPGDRLVPIPRQAIAIGGDYKTVDALTYRNVRRCGDEQGRELKNQLDTKELILPTPTAVPPTPTVAASSDKMPAGKDQKGKALPKKDNKPAEKETEQKGAKPKSDGEPSVSAGDGGVED